MRIAKPATRRVYVTAADPETGTTKTTTVYGTSPREFVAWLRSQIDPNAPAAGRKRRAAVAAAGRAD